MSGIRNVLDSVAEFALAMLEKLRGREAEYGDSWRSVETSMLVRALQEHVAKAIQRRQPRDWVDVADFAMFLYFRDGAITEAQDTSTLQAHGDGNGL